VNKQQNKNMTTNKFYGFSISNRDERATWFHTAAAAQRFSDACGFENVTVEAAADVDPDDVMDTAEIAWTLESLLKITQTK
jgi:hypothetical protein